MGCLEIKNKMCAIASGIFKNSPVLFAYLYGSIALDQAHRFSDLDVAICIAPGMSAKEGLSLELALSLEIDRQLVGGPPSDVRIMNWLPLTVAGQIVTDGILLYCRDDDARIDYETFIRCAYFDFSPVIRNFQKDYLEHIAD
jgi:predicted nucleotidyltransferase